MRQDQLEMLKGLWDREGVPYECGTPLARYTTFKIGGPVALFARPADARQLEAALAACKKSDVRYYLLGQGSNTLFADEGFDGAVICTRMMGDVPRIEGERMTAPAGAGLTALCAMARDAGLTGLEFACGIPGSLGGALYMNAGAYGGEMKDVVETVTCLTPEGTVETRPADALAFGYRTSVFEQDGSCVLSATLRLARGDKAAIRARMAELLAKRREKQPLEWPSAGSTFKRPQGAFAAALIEQCGLKGLQVGGAAVSQKHSGFVVNLGGATCADVIALTEQVIRVVKEKTGYTLEREIRVVK